MRTTAGSDCLYVKGNLGGVHIDWLIDTGAAPNVLNYSFYDKLNPNQRPILNPVTTRIQAAEGTSLNVHGEADFDIVLDGLMISAVRFIVADLDNIHGILGMNFFSKTSCIINVSEGYISVNTKHVSMYKQGVLSSCVNNLSDGVSISGGGKHAVETEYEEHIQLYPRMTVSELPDHLQEMAQETLSTLDPALHSTVCGIIFSNRDLFLEPGSILGRTKLIEHTINTGDANPIKRRPYKPTISQKPIIEQQIADMLASDQIVPSNSPWSAPVILVGKKDGGSRFCVDYRGLNEVTIKDSYPLPNIQDCLDTLSGSKWFSTLDLASGYWQCEVDPSDQHKTAFITHKGLYQFKVLPFGLTNAPATFERLMDQVLNGMLGEKCLCFLDDIVALGDTFEAAVLNLQSVFDRLKSAGLTLKPKKCNLFRQKVSYLGHVVSADGITCDPDKIEAVANWKTPRTVTEVRSFLGFANYYRRFIQSFAHIASPLSALTQKGKPFKWTDECEKAFQVLKKTLIEAPILAYPSSNPDDTYILDTDASLVGIGAVLSQRQNGVERVIAYASQTLSRAQRNYCTTYRELLAVVSFIKHFKHYLLGQTQFIIRTDHMSLKWLINFKDAEGLIGRWLVSIQPYNYVIEHRRGVNHGNADGMSRKEPLVRRRRCNRAECKECPTTHKVQVENKIDDDRMEVVNAVQPNVTSDSGSNSGGTGSGTESDATILETNWLQNWSNEDLQTLQRNDPAIKIIIAWKESGMVRPTRDDLHAQGSEVRDYCGQWANLEMIDGLLYRKWIPKSTKRVCRQLLTPVPIRSKIFNQLHEVRTAGHMGIRRTLLKVRQRFFWPRCKTDIQRWCKQCVICAKVKPGPGFRAKLHQVPIRNKLDRVAIDILGELPETDDGNKYILVVSDYYTKWTQAIALPNQLAQTVADKLMIEFFSVFGMPKVLHSDQGRNFESHLFRQLCELLGIEKTRTTPFRPQSDGLVERYNRTIQAMLKSFVNENRNDWDQHLPYLCMAYRSTPHESTGCSPNLMMFGQENDLPLDIIVGSPPLSKPGIECPVKYIEWLRTSLVDIHQYANDQLGRSAKRQKHYYDIRSKPQKYQVNDFVWRWYPPAARGKLAKGWKGPYKIVALPTPTNSILKYTPDTVEFRVHIDSLKPYHGPIPVAWENDSPISTSPEDRADDVTITEDRADDVTSPEDRADDITSPGSYADDIASSDEDSNDEESTDDERTESPIQMGRGFRVRRPVKKYSP